MEYVAYTFAVLILAVLLWIDMSAKPDGLDKILPLIEDFAPTKKYISPTNSWAIAIDEERRELCLLFKEGKSFCSYIYDFIDIVDFEIKTVGQLSSNASFDADNRTMKFGQKIKRVDLKLVVNDMERPVYLINFFSGSTAPGSESHVRALKNASEWESLFKIIRKRMITRKIIKRPVEGSKLKLPVAETDLPKTSTTPVKIDQDR